ncbi:MAG: hypothetical protein ACOCP8_00995 [archaeon]
MKKEDIDKLPIYKWLDESGMMDGLDWSAENGNKDATLEANILRNRFKDIEDIIKDNLKRLS